jgi:HEAT repeat protein
MKKYSALTACVLFLGIALVLGQEPRPPLRPLAELVKALDSEDVNERVEAMVGLTELGPKAAPAVPKLIKALLVADKNLTEEQREDLRLNSMLALGEIKGPAIKALGELTAEKDPSHRYYVIWAIGMIGADAKELAPNIIAALGDKDDSVRRKAAFALGRVAADPELAIAELAKILKDKEEDVRHAAAEGLSKYGDKAVPTLMEVLKTGGADAQRLAGFALGEVGSDAKAAVPDLQKIMIGKDQSHNEVHWTAQALAKIGKAALPAFSAAIKDDRETIRQAALSHLGQMKGDGVELLVDGLGDKRVDVRRLSAQVLNGLQVSDKSVVIALAFALKDDDDIVKVSAANALQNLGVGAKLAAPYLRKALADLNQEVRVSAFYALQGMGEDAQKALLANLESKDNKVRVNTACLMIHVGLEIKNAVPILRDGLKEKDVAVRVQAAHALAQAQQEVDKILPVLSEGLKHQKVAIRSQSLQGLQMLQQKATSVVPAVLTLLADPDANLRQQAVWTLQQLRGDPEIVVPAVAKLLKDDNAQVRITAVQILPQYGSKAIAHIIDLIGDKEESVRQQAIWALHNIQGDLSSALPILTKVLKSDNQQVRQAVIHLLPRTGEKGVPFILDALKDKEENTRIAAAAAIQNLGNQGKKAAPGIAQMLVDMVAKDPSGSVRLQVVYALLSQGPESVKMLVDTANKGKNADVRKTVLQGMSHWGRGFSGHDQVLPFLIDCLKEEEAEMRWTACRGLLNMGATAKPALPQLKAALQDKDANVRVHAMNALANIGPEGQSAIAESWKNLKDAGMRQHAVQALANYGYNKKDAVPIALEGLKDKNNQTRMMAAQLLNNIGRDAAKEAAPALTKALMDSDQNVRSFAINALNSMGELAHPALVDSLKDGSSPLRQNALQLLASQNYRSKAGVPNLIAALKDKSASVKSQAASLLEQIGPDAKAAIPTLESLLRDDDAGVRQHAQAALKRIKGK